MNRTLRNGLAVAGMAGGMLFLGQAVASAEEGVDQANDAVVTQSVEDEGHGSAGDNDADVDQENELDYEADATGGDVTVGADITNVVGGNDVNAGGGGSGYEAAKKEEPKPAPTTTVRVTFDTVIDNEVNIDSTVANSGNAAVTAPNVTQSNTATVDQESENEGHKGNHGPRHDSPASFGSGGGGGGGSGDNDADVDQENEADIDLDADAGDITVGADITNVVGGNTVNCWGDKHSTVTCDVTFDTTINNTVNIHSIICGSGNAVIGTLPSFVCNLAPAAAAPAAPAAQQAKPAAHKNYAAHRAAAPKALSSAQPSSKGQLASTGSDVSAPLTLGLLALGAGGALSLAGRRRQTTTV